MKAACIVLLRRTYPKLHDLTELYEGLREALELRGDVEAELPILSGFYELARYPNAGLRRLSQAINMEVAGG